VVWEDYAAGNWEIYYSTSSDGGATWSTPVNISHTILAESSNSDIAVDNSGNICVVWQDYAMGNWEIYYSTSSDGGATWSTPVNISKNARVSAQPAIAMDNSGNLHVVWQDNSPTHWEIYYATSTDGGATWSTPVIITGDDYISEYPDIAIDSSSNLHVVWQDGIPNSEIYYAISPDGGTSWSHLVNISRNPSSKSELPDITIDNDDNLHVVWDDDATSDWEIYYATSSDGVWWSTPDNISHSTEYSGGAAIAIDNSDNPHVVWQEYVDGWNWEIYYASPVGGGGGGGLSGGAIAGIVVGSCAVAAGLITYFVIRRRRKRRAAG
jgi:hypothetical protein